jgi:hypothetical protein
LLATLALSALWPINDVARAAGTTQATLVQTIHTSAWSAPSPDPSGITYWPGHDTLLIVDGEVDEMPDLFTGDNVFESTRSGSLVDTYRTTAFSKESVGIDVDINPSTGHFFVSDDNKDKVFEIAVGTGGPVQLVGSFSTTAFGDSDPEGLTFGQGQLYITDGAGAEVYILAPGPNGRFDGVPPTSDDVLVGHFDTAALGQPDPEGIEFNTATNTLYLVSKQSNSHTLTEVTTGGTFVQSIDLSFLNPKALSDLTFAPGSQNASVMNLYITDRGVDNNADPDENDGKVYEISLQEVQSGDNLLANGGFEDDANGDGKPDIWNKKTQFTRNAGEGSVTPHGGSFVGRHFAADNSGYTISQTVGAVTAGTTYHFNGWVNIPATGDSFTLQLQLHWLNANGSTISKKTFKTYSAATNGWNQASFSQLAPAGATNAQIRMVVKSLNAGIYVDDFEFHS